MGNNSSFQRTDEVTIERSVNCPDWLEEFAEKLAIQEQQLLVKNASKTAVEIARNRDVHQPSIYEMMSSIINKQKPKFSSVEEAVIEYQKRTGLSDYLKRNADDQIKLLASQIVQASEEIVEDFEKKNSKPTIIENFPEIENFIVNTLETNNKIQIPALLHDIISIFSRDGIDHQIFSDQEFLNWLNELIVSKTNNITSPISSQIGRNVGTSVNDLGANDSNKNPFTLLEVKNTNH